ncbi:MAG: hypothetical protein ACRDGB_04925 [Candidatus Limnocylindria bacterium]
MRIRPFLWFPMRLTRTLIGLPARRCPRCEREVEWRVAGILSSDKIVCSCEDCGMRLVIETAVHP